MNTLPGDAVGTDLSNLSEEQKEAVRASHAVLDDYIVSFSNGDNEGLKRTYTWPTIRIASGKIKVINTVEDLQVNPKEEQKKAGSEEFLAKVAFANYGHSEWVYRKLVQAGPNKCHWDCCFRRMSPDGKENGRFQSLYVVAFVAEENKWGIQARSSFAP